MKLELFVGSLITPFHTPLPFPLNKGKVNKDFNFFAVRQCQITAVPASASSPSLAPCSPSKPSEPDMRLIIMKLDQGGGDIDGRTYVLFPLTLESRP